MTSDAALHGCGSLRRPGILFRSLLNRGPGTGKGRTEFPVSTHTATRRSVLAGTFASDALSNPGCTGWENVRFRP